MDKAGNASGEQLCDSVHSFYPRNAKTWIRHVSVSLLASLFAGRSRYEAMVKTPRLQFLCLHHLFADEEQAFRDLLEYLLESHRLLSYESGIAQLSTNTIHEPSIVLSFDDGFKSCLKLARILQEYEVSAGFFICPSVIGLKDAVKVASYCRDRLLVPPVPFLDRKELEMIQDLGHLIGYHTWSHPRLSELSSRHFKREFDDGLAVLEDWVGPVKHFAWPFGKFGDIGNEVSHYLSSLDFKSIASAERGCHLANNYFNGDRHYILRDPWVATWPLRHLRFFMLRNIYSAKRISQYAA